MIISMKILVAIVFLIFSQSFLIAQNLLNNPESVVYDSANDRYLVSNCGDGKIVEINNQGEQSYFNTELGYAFGLVLEGETLYVVSNDGNYPGIVGLNLSDGLINFHVEVPEKELLNDITSDGKGNLYVTDCDADKIFKISISNKNYITLVDSGLGYPNGILYDESKNRLLILNCLLTGYPITSVNTDGSSMSTIVYTGLGSIDGLTVDNNGFFYFSSWDSDKTYRYDPDFTIKKDIVSENHKDPADIFFDKVHNQLVIPNYTSNEVQVIDVSTEYLFSDFNSEIQSGHAPLEVHFIQNTLTNQEITSWAWDFDSDGVTDSNEENPSFIYEFPGNYNVTLAISTNQDNLVVTKEEYISVFDGQSAVKFEEKRSNISIPADVNLNLIDQLTIEAVIKPISWGSGLQKQVLLDKDAVQIFVIGNSLLSTKDSTLGGQLKFNNGTTVNFLLESGTIKLNEWQHIALSYNSANSDLIAYLNGSRKQVTYVGSNEPSGSLLDNENVPLALGNDQSLNNFFDGIMDELRIWGNVRNNSEIAEYMSVGLAGTEDGLVGYWNMNEGNGTEIIDLSLTGGNGQVELAHYVQGVDLALLTDLEENTFERTKPSEFYLSQNYPNPFNPSTVIQFTIPSNLLSEENGNRFNVELRIYNLLGQLVATLVNEKLDAGSHEVTWNAGKFASGIYLYRLIIDNANVITKKMLLLM